MAMLAGLAGEEALQAERFASQPIMSGGKAAIGSSSLLSPQPKATRKNKRIEFRVKARASN
jgi:hypothetical protein